MLDEKDINLQVNHEAECRKVISVEIAPSRYQDESERVVKDLMKTVSIPGFRKGKVPADIVKVRYADQIKVKAIERILPLAYGHVVSSEKLRPVAEPVFSDIEADGEKPLTFKIEVECAPEFGPTDYRGVDVKAEEVNIGDEEIDNVLKTLQDREAEFITVDRPAVSGDLVFLDYAPLDENGDVIEDQQNTDYPIVLGTGQVFEQFDKAVAGTAVGVTSKVDIDCPDDYKPERLAGKKVTYTYTVKGVREKRVRTLDDEFAKKLDEKFKTIADLRSDIEKRLMEEKGREAKRKREEMAVDLLIERNPFDAPRSMIDNFKQRLGEDDKKRREAAGVGPEEDEERKKEIDRLFEQVAVRNIKRYFLIGRIADEKNVTVSDEELDSEIERIANDSGKPLNDVKKVFKKGSENVNNLTMRLRERKVFEIIFGSK